MPEEQIILRYRNAIYEKYNTKYFKYLENGIVQSNDSYVIAINGCKIPSSRTDFNPPRIVRSILPLGFPQVTLDMKSNNITNQTYQYRDKVIKNSGSDVSTDIFFDDYYNKISAILFSNVDPANRSKMFGQDYILTYNHRAKNPVKKEIIKRGVEYRVMEFPDKFELSSRDLN